jgi:hypothetical protein
MIDSKSLIHTIAIKAAMDPTIQTEIQPTFSEIKLVKRVHKFSLILYQEKAID